MNRMVYVWKEELQGSMFYRIYRPFFGEFILERVVTFTEVMQRINSAEKNFEKIIIGPPKFLTLN